MIVPGAGCVENSCQKVKRNEIFIESWLSQFLKEAINLPSADTCLVPDKYDIGIDIYVVKWDLGTNDPGNWSSNTNGNTDIDLFLNGFIFISLIYILIFAKPKIIILCRSYFILNGNTDYQINIKETVSIRENIKFLLKTWTLNDTQTRLHSDNRIKMLFLKATIKALTAIQK